MRLPGNDFGSHTAYSSLLPGAVAAEIDWSWEPLHAAGARSVWSEEPSSRIGGSGPPEVALVSCTITWPFWTTRRPPLMDVLGVIVAPELPTAPLVASNRVTWMGPLHSPCAQLSALSSTACWLLISRSSTVVPGWFSLVNVVPLSVVAQRSPPKTKPTCGVANRVWVIARVGWTSGTSLVLVDADTSVPVNLCTAAQVLRSVPDLSRTGHTSEPQVW